VRGYTTAKQQVKRPAKKKKHLLPCKVQRNTTSGLEHAVPLRQKKETASYISKQSLFTQQAPLAGTQSQHKWAQEER